MNTDNMSIMGLTIDYGPFGFMEYFNPRLVSNHSDNEARYRYEEQPKTCKWNLMRLSEALDPLLPIEWSSNFLNTHFDELYSQTYLGQMALKLGFVTTATSSDKDSLDDHEFDLIQSLFVVMQETSADFTNTFRTLSLLSRDPSDKETLKTV
jgi:serine/tyrosine/threonine adenylyltransferase